MDLRSRAPSVIPVIAVSCVNGVAQDGPANMDVANPAQVFGPTLVAYDVLPNPDPAAVFQGIKC